VLSIPTGTSNIFGHVTLNAVSTSNPDYSGFSTTFYSPNMLQVKMSLNPISQMLFVASGYNLLRYDSSNGTLVYNQTVTHQLLLNSIITNGDNQVWILSQGSLNVFDVDGTLLTTYLMPNNTYNGVVVGNQTVIAYGMQEVVGYEASSCDGGCYGNGECDGSVCYCNSSYYLPNCTVFCSPNITCPTTGLYQCNYEGKCECQYPNMEPGCNECTPNFWGPYCDINCTNTTCMHGGSCAISGSCYCPPPYSGAICDQCLENYYGPNCTTYCISPITCNSGGKCDQNGACVCDSFHTGSSCQYCIEGYYGPPYCREIVRSTYRKIMNSLIAIAATSVGIIAVAAFVIFKSKLRVKELEVSLPKKNNGHR